MKAQRDRLLQYMRDGNAVDGLSAWHKLGIYRLSARIMELRESHDIKDQWVKGLNQFGESVRWKQYYLEE